MEEIALGKEEWDMGKILDLELQRLHIACRILNLQGSQTKVLSDTGKKDEVVADIYYDTTEHTAPNLELSTDSSEDLPNLITQESPESKPSDAKILLDSSTEENSDELPIQESPESKEMIN